MKQFTLMLLLLAAVCGVSAQTSSSLTLTPAQPKQKGQFSFIYDKSTSSLQGQPKIDVVVYQMTDAGPGLQNL